MNGARETVVGNWLVGEKKWLIRNRKSEGMGAKWLYVQKDEGKTWKWEECKGDSEVTGCSSEDKEERWSGAALRDIRSRTVRKGKAFLWSTSTLGKAPEITELEVPPAASTHTHIPLIHTLSLCFLDWTHRFQTEAFIYLDASSIKLYKERQKRKWTASLLEDMFFMSVWFQDKDYMRGLRTISFFPCHHFPHSEWSLYVWVDAHALHSLALAHFIVHLMAS